MKVFTPLAFCIASDRLKDDTKLKVFTPQIEYYRLPKKLKDDTKLKGTHTYIEDIDKPGKAEDRYQIEGTHTLTIVLKV